MMLALQPLLMCSSLRSAAFDCCPLPGGLQLTCRELSVVDVHALWRQYPRAAAPWVEVDAAQAVRGQSSGVSPQHHPEIAYSSQRHLEM
jgi:hypothetical protein